MQVKTILAYAAARFILVVPEIELPGHSCAAIACYPNLSCEYPLVHLLQTVGCGTLCP